MKIACLVILAVATCGEQPRARTAEDVVRARGEAERILRVRDGEEIGEEVMLADLARARVVYLGERHDRATDHAMEHRIIRELYSRDPSMGIGLEMLQTPYQPVLNQWVNGDLDEMALRRDAEWDTRWGHDFALYRPLLEFIRARHVRAYALNAPQEITRVVARDGIDALDEEQRASLPTLNTGDVMHRGLVMGALGEHAEQMSEERLERMYTAQVIWDETMARSVVEAMEGAVAPAASGRLGGTAPRTRGPRDPAARGARRSAAVSNRARRGRGQRRDTGAAARGPARRRLPLGGRRERRDRVI